MSSQRMRVIIGLKNLFNNSGSGFRFFRSRMNDGPLIGYDIMAMAFRWPNIAYFKSDCSSLILPSLYYECPLLLDRVGASLGRSSHNKPKFDL